MARRKSAPAIIGRDRVAEALMTSAEFKAAMSRLNASLDEMVPLLGVCRRNIAGYRTGVKPVPLTVALATRQLLQIAERPATDAN